ncbi:MAG: response regulator [Spirochaetaceae bacterium]|nr:MAG: response regulator [Spirochaetaceae bacterium]
MNNVQHRGDSRLRVSAPGKLCRSLIVTAFLLLSAGGVAGQDLPPGVLVIPEDGISRWLPIPLRGEWLFLPDHFVPARRDTAQRDTTRRAPAEEGWVPLKVPGSWYPGPSGSGPYGFGTYRLTVYTHDYDGTLGILFPDQAIAFRCHLNGDLVAVNGDPRESYVATRVMREAVLIPLDPGAGRYELLCHVANYHYNVGGMINPPRLGDYRLLSVLRDGEILFTGLFAGALLVIALYYLLLFFQQTQEVRHGGTSLPKLPRARSRQEREALYFALFCLVVLARVLTVNHLPERLIEHPWAFETSVRLEFISLYLALPLYVTLLGTLFTIPRIAIVSRVTGAFAVVGTVLVLLLSVPDFTRYTLTPFHVLTVATGIYILVGLARCARQREPGAAALLAGFAFFFLVILNDILHAALIVRTAHLLPMGMLFFVLAHFVVLTRRHAGAEARTRELAATIARERDSLDDRVRERTTALELANGKLRRQEEARLEFVATISHELRTPLTLIITPLDQAGRGKYGPALPVDGTVVRSIRRNALRLETLIENLLDYSRFELGRLVPQKTPVELDGLVTALTAELVPVAEEKGLTLNCTGTLSADASGEAWMEGDLRLLELAFFNLLSNALKFTPAGGSVEVRLGLGSSGAAAEVAVTDTGVGIAEEDQPHIFEKFYRGCAEVDGSRPGSGIGLPLTKAIMDVHGGELHARSTPGEGSTFTMILPLMERTGALEAADGITATRAASAREYAATGATPPAARTPIGLSTAPAAPNPHGRSTILVVEDNTELRAYLTDALAEQYDVLGAADGEEALKQIRGPRRPDLVIADIMMPGIDGEELFKTVRRAGKFPDLPFLFLTARTDRTLENRLRHAGAVDYIRKPFNMEELLLKVRSLVALQAGIRIRTETEYARRLTDFLGLTARVPEESLAAIAGTPVSGARIAGAQIPDSNLTSSLTAREEQICTHLVRGMTDKEIGTALGISGRTVSNTLTRLYRKYGVTNRTELTALLGR